jgi:phage-related baseplate assembly protein
MTISAFTAVDLSQLPAPNIVEELSFETIFQAMLADLQDRDPTFTAIVASDPAYKILEVAAYRELLIRQRVNDAAKAVMLGYATGSNLDQIAANFNTQRLVIDEGDSESAPPIPPTLESDSALRRRVQLSFEGLSVAGPASAYILHAMNSHADIKDVYVSSPDPGEVLVAILSREGDGTASSEIIDAVIEALNEDVRPLTDSVSVQSAEIIEYDVTAVLTIYAGPDSDLILQTAQDSVQNYVSENHKIGRDITLSGLYAALHVAGVQNVSLTSPEEDLEIDPDKAAYCTDIDVTIGGVDE